MRLNHPCTGKETRIKEELIYLILQFLDEEKFMLTRHKYPILQDKVKFPCMDKSRLLPIIKQSMDWWVLRYTEARANPNNMTFLWILYLENLTFVMVHLFP
ncbi:hypothetical protein K1719_046157 [Acacia pycnantha]|nr:hypothetical protein K1719_046157 [Acacia pycnantha]